MLLPDVFELVRRALVSAWHCRSPMSSFNPSDLSALFERARGRDPGAWKRIFDGHFPRLFRLFVAYLDGADDAEEAALSVMIEAYRTIPLRARHELRDDAWIYLIARDRLAGLHGPAVGFVHDGFVHEGVRRVLTRLPHEERVALELHHIVGLTIEQTAALTGWTTGAVRRLLATATRMFEAAAEQ